MYISKTCSEERGVPWSRQLQMTHQPLKKGHLCRERETAAGKQVDHSLYTQCPLTSLCASLEYPKDSTARQASNLPCPVSKSVLLPQIIIAALETTDRVDQSTNIYHFPLLIIHKLWRLLSERTIGYAVRSSPS